MNRAVKRERHEATGVADVAAVTVMNCLRGALSGAESQLADGALATDLPGFPVTWKLAADETEVDREMALRSLQKRLDESAGERGQAGH